MTNSIKYQLPALGVVFLLLTGCVTEPQLEKVLDPRLDKLVSQSDQALANQATVNAQLQAQQQQLEAQQQNLAALNVNLGNAFKTPEAGECPKAAACPSVLEVSNKMVVGGLEKVWFPDLGLALMARIDTGAATASMDAQEIEQFERDGERWVRFTIANPKSDKPEILERRLVRTLGFSKTDGAETKRRPVVKMGIVIGQNEQTAEFSLSDRSHADYQVKIGRSILRDVMVVDVSKKNVAPYIVPDETSGSKGAGK